MESREFKGGCEIRTGAAGKPMIAGYGALFNVWSPDLGGFREQIDPHTFDKTIREADIRALANHNKDWLLGRTGNGTMRLGTDSRGMEYEIDVNMSDPDGQRALAKVERGDWDGASFSFRTIRDDWNFRSAPRERRLLEVALADVGPVTFPAYPDTSSVARGAARSLADALGMEYRDVETALTVGGLDSLFDESRDTWTTAYMNDLPDSAFLYVEDGGKKDAQGKTTPRSLRHFPYKNANGQVDLPHLRNALARIPDSNLPQSVKDDATAKAKGILAHQGESNSRVVNIPEHRAAGDVAWGPEDGFVDLAGDITYALNGDNSWRFCAVDVALTLDKALVTDWQEGLTYVVPITVGEDNAPTVSDTSAWTAVDQGWVSTEAERSIAVLAAFEKRAGRVLSAATVKTIQTAIGHLQDLIKDATDGDTEGLGPEPATETYSLSDAEVESRLRQLQGPRRYAPTVG